MLSENICLIFVELRNVTSLVGEEHIMMKQTLIISMKEI